MSDIACMELALEEARLAAAEDEVPVGAVLLCEERVIARAHNRTEQTQNAMAHAEMLCLQEGVEILGRKWLMDCTLYVTLEPCAMCAGAMVNLRLGRLVFGAFDVRCGCCGSVLDLVTEAFYHTVPTVGGMAEGACADLLSAYFKAKR